MRLKNWVGATAKKLFHVGGFVFGAIFGGGFCGVTNGAPNEAVLGVLSLCLAICIIGICTRRMRSGLRLGCGMLIPLVILAALLAMTPGGIAVFIGSIIGTFIVSALITDFIRQEK